MFNDPKYSNNIKHFNMKFSNIQTILETFNSDVDIEWLAKRDCFGECGFTINGSRYIVTFKQDDWNGWEILFGLYDQDKHTMTYKMTNTGNQYQIFSALYKAYMTFLSPKNPTYLYASASIKSRQSLYQKLFRVVHPDWDISYSGGFVHCISPDNKFEDDENTV